MASTSKASAYEHIPQAHETYPDVIVEIQGLEDQGNGTYRLRGVRPIEIGHEAFLGLTESLVSQGVPPRQAERLTEEAFDTVQLKLLAEALAQRTRRVA